MNRFNWLIKRELWENRSIWLGMPIAAACARALTAG